MKNIKKASKKDNNKQLSASSVVKDLISISEKGNDTLGTTSSSWK